MESWKSLVKEANYLGRVHPDTHGFSDLPKVLKAFSSPPQMRTLEVYHDTRLVFGYEVTYWLSGRVFQVGHHIGGHLTGDVRCDTFVFEDGEYISEFRVSSGDLVDRIELTTNTGRTFQAGGPGGSLL